MMLSRYMLSIVLSLPLLNAHMLQRQAAPLESASLTTTTVATESNTPTVCTPVDSQGNPDMDAPCNLIAAMAATCGEGSDGGNPSLTGEQSCYCGEGGAGLNFFEDLAGCFNCERLHGGPIGDLWYPIQYISAQSSSYCALATPTQGLGDFIAGWTASSGIDIGTSTGGMDVLGTSTQVALYFTSTPVTGGSVAAGATTASSNADTTSGGAAASSNTESFGGVTAGGPTTSSVGPTATSSNKPATTSHSGAGVLEVPGLMGALALGVACSHSELPPEGQLTDITSSTKKRKLSKPELTDGPTLPYESPLLSAFAVRQIRTGSSSPPRAIPHHLLIQDNPASRSPTPDVSTAASSPSAAYAGLTLEGEYRNSEGVALGLDAKSPTDNTRLSAGKSILSGIAGQTRSASPAKRTRSDMSDDKGDDERTPDGHSSSQDQISDPQDVEPGNKHAKLATNRHRRDVSVDMLAYQRNTPPGAGDQNATPDESGDNNSSNGAYLTPQSGISIPSSSTVSSKPVSKPKPAMSVSPAEEPRPPIDDQIAMVSKLAQAPLENGEKGYIISKEWLARVQARGTQTHKGAKLPKEFMEGDIGPVDNMGLNMITDPTTSFEDEAGEPYIPLKPGLQITDDFEVIPEAAWNLIIKWYGLAEGSPVMTRYCHNTTTSDTVENLQFELHPPVFTILKLPDRSSGINMQSIREKNLPPVKILASRHEGFQQFLKRAKLAAGIDMKTKVRVWRLLSGLRESLQAGMLTPAQSRSNSPAPNVAAPVDPGSNLVVDVNAFLSLQQGSQRELLEVKDETMNEKYNGRSNLSFVGLNQDDVIILEEQIGGPAGGEWVSGAVAANLERSSVPVSTTKNGFTTVNSLKPKANTASGRTSPAPGSGIMTRGRAQKNGRTRGTVGLGNLGNTCYMNSALQCVKSVEELTMYFLEEYYKKELNPRNPLSHNGDVARAYAALLKELYGENTNSSFSPRIFKQVIGRYGPSFSGYGQQDSQEFLLFLLDGLQEDLNRIYKKPYIEKPDSTDEMVNNPAALAELAEKSWAIYKARNDSVITDLFAGMYKSTVVCPECAKVSIIFDPFNNLTLQLPSDTYSTWYKRLFIFPLWSRPYRVAVDIDKNSTFATVKEYVGRKTKIDPKRMVLAEIYKHRYFKVFNDKVSVSDERLAENDVIAIFELDEVPTNYPPPKRKIPKYRSMLYNNNSDEDEDLPEGESPLADQMLVAVFNRYSSGNPQDRFHKRLFGVPSYITLTKEEARDYDSILRKVLGRVATMTTVDILRLDEERSETESTQQDSDTVLMSNDDTDSSSDTKVKAKSVQSEDGMVDISMKDAEEAPTTPLISYPPQPEIHKRVSRLIQPGEFIDPDLRSMFDMKYFSGTEMIPTGWNALQDENREYPSIASRIPQQRPVRPKRTMAEKLAHRIKHNGSGSSSDDEADDPPPSAPSMMIVQANEDDLDASDDGLPEVAELMNPESRGSSRLFGKKLFRKPGLITYSHKGKNRFAAQNHDGHGLDGAEDERTDDGDPQLLGLGEAIILDWTREAHDMLFWDEPVDETGGRGRPTWTDVPLQEDPELDRQRQIRKNRKDNGVSLDDCLDEFGKLEILSQDDAWYCPRCKEHRRASKKFELWKSPDILVIHLKRFSNQGRMRDKLDVFVEFPVEGLDLSSRLAVQEEGKSQIYDLFGVDNHYGGMGGGHYTAYAKNFYDKNWYEYNDSMASRIQNTNRVVTAAAYLLFYRRRSTGILGGPFFENILNKSPNLSQETTLSEPTSRNESPPTQSGEDKRLDDYSRLGSSSALLGVEAAHQTGNGGPAAAGTMSTVLNRNLRSDEEPPQYSSMLNDGEQTVESMEVDEPTGGGLDIRHARDSSWEGFGPLSDQEVGEGSMKANSSTGATDADDRDVRSLSEFDGEMGLGTLGTPETRPVGEDEEEVPILEGRGVGEDVREIRLSDEEETFKID